MTKDKADFATNAIVSNPKELFTVVVVEDVQWVAPYILTELLVLGLKIEKLFSCFHAIGQ